MVYIEQDSKKPQTLQWKHPNDKKRLVTLNENTTKKNDYKSQVSFFLFYT